MLDVIDKGQLSNEHPHPLLFVHGAFQGGWSWDVHFLDFFADRGFRVLAFLDRETICTTPDPDRALDGGIRRAEIPRNQRRAGRGPARVCTAARTCAIPAADHAPTPLGLHAIRADRPAGRYVWGDVGGRTRLALHCHDTESVVREGTERLQPDSTRAILGDMIALKLINTARVTTPLLVLGGEQDAIYTVSDAYATAKAYGTQPMFIPDVGHGMTLEPKWATVAGHILSWLQERGL